MKEHFMRIKKGTSNTIKDAINVLEVVNKVGELKSFSAKWLRHTPNEYLEEIKNQNKTIQEVAKAIGINSRTLNALLTNPDKDIDYKTHKKLMKYLYKQDI